ncbi:MAG: LCP family protein [Acidimicrobiales bacterium]
MARERAAFEPLDHFDPPSEPTPTGPAPAMDRRTLQRARRKQAKKARKARHRWPRRLLYAVIVLALVVVGLGAGTYVYATYRFHQIKKIHAPHLVAQAPPGKPFNILLVGSDSRSFVKSSSQVTEFGTPTVESGQRSDVLIVARIVPATKEVWMMSIPRDLWVDIPGTGPDSGTNRINAAFNTGPDLLIQTIEHDLGIPINHYVAVNFTGFQAMVNALGGITMDFPTPVKDAYSGLDVTQTGCQQVDGATALELVRARHLYYQATGEWQYDGLSDFSRIQRQDAFFRSVLTKLSRVTLNPITVNNFIGAAVSDMTIDTTLSESDLISIAEQFHGLPQGNLHTETLPTYGFTTTGGADVLGMAVPQAQQMIAAFNQVGATSSTAGSGSTGSTAGSTAGSTTTTAPSLPPSQVDVQVLNGVDFTQPIASETAASLRQLGFDVTGIANATAEGVATTEIQYAPGHKEAATTLASHISGATQLASDAHLTGDQVVLVVGGSFTGVTGASTGSAATGTTGTTGTTASSATGATGTTTTTTPPTAVYTNTQQEPWNPTPCVVP